MPIFRVKSGKIYTGQKNLHWRRQWRQWQLSGMGQASSSLSVGWATSSCWKVLLWSCNLPNALALMKLFRSIFRIFEVKTMFVQIIFHEIWISHQAKFYHISWNMNKLPDKIGVEKAWPKMLPGQHSTEKSNLFCFESSSSLKEEFPEKNACSFRHC